MDQAVGIWVAAVLTLMVYSFLIADNPLFRLAEHLLVGTALGYAALIVVDRVILPSLGVILVPAASVNPVTRIMTAIGLFWGLLLWAWLIRPARWLASWSLAIVFGVGAALAVGGSLVGTLIPHVGATLRPLSGDSLLDNFVTVVVVLAGLTYFFFTIRRDRPLGKVVQGVARFGRWSLMVVLGSLLGSRVVSLLSAVVERFQFLYQWVSRVFS